MLFEETRINVYTDLACADAEPMPRKAVLADHIGEIEYGQGIELAHASILTGVNVLILEHWLNGRFRTASEEDLRACLAQLQRFLAQ